MYRPTNLGILLTRNPQAAHSKLKGLFAKHKTVEAVAKATRVHRDTVRVWANKLVGMGLGDPRVLDQES